MSPEAALERLAARVAAEGEPLSLRDDPATDGPRPGALAAAGPRTAADPGAYALIVESVREGYLCHYESSRVLDIPDPDLALLAGDLFYAIGISSLAEFDDAESVRILSDLIRMSAELRSSGRDDEAEVLWRAQIMALACGSDDRQRVLIEALRADENGASEALEGWSDLLADRHGIGPTLSELREPIHLPPSKT